MNKLEFFKGDEFLAAEYSDVKTCPLTNSGFHCSCWDQGYCCQCEEYNPHKEPASNEP